MPEITEDDRRRARVALGFGASISTRALSFESNSRIEGVAEVLAELRAELSTDRTEDIRMVREHAWSDGYAACHRGEQPHNPYRAPRPGVAG